jgi:hypothetical protein
MNNKLKLFIFKNSELIKQNKTKLINFIPNQQYNYKQIGGNNQLKIDYNNKIYIYEQTMDENYYVLFSKNNDECVSVIIDKKNNIADIHGIGNYNSCLDNINTNVGSILLQITIKMIKKYKDKYKIKQIILTDNSIKQCHNKQIKLAIMITLLTGHTWYGKSGFRPFDKSLIQRYENNINIMNNIKLKDINLIKYLKKTSLPKDIIEESKIYIKNHLSMLLKDYLTKFIKQYDNTCLFFYDFYEDLFMDIKLYNFHRNVFVLDI